MSLDWHLVVRLVAQDQGLILVLIKQYLVLPQSEAEANGLEIVFYAKDTEYVVAIAKEVK